MQIFSYDYILKLESVGEELPFVLKNILKADKIPRLEEPKDKQSVEKLLKYVKQVPTDLVLKVLKRYETDFEIFGYEMLRTEQDILDIFK